MTPSPQSPSQLEELASSLTVAIIGGMGKPPPSIVSAVGVTGVNNGAE